MADNNQMVEQRGPRNLNGLLGLVTSVTAKEDTTKPCSEGVMDPERQKFLKHAFDTMTSRPDKEMAQMLSIICSIMDSEEQTDEELKSVENGLKNILDFIDNIDYANDFVKMGGAKQLLMLLDQFEGNCLFTSLACDIFGTVFQNNPKAQEGFNDADTIERLMSLTTETADESVYVKAVYAISCLVRENPAGLATFLAHPGVPWLASVVGSGRRKACLKGVLLVKELLRQGCREQLDEHALLPSLLDVLAKEQNIEDLTYDSFREYMAGVVYRWCTLDRGAAAVCGGHDGVRAYLEKRGAAIQAEPETLQEELLYITGLLKMLQ